MAQPASGIRVGFRIARLLRPAGLPQLPARADRLDRYSRAAGGGGDGAPVPDRAFVHPTDQWQVSRRAINGIDRKSTRLNSSHLVISYAVFCLKKKQK